MVRFKGPCRRADLQRVQNRRVHLNEPAAVQKLSHRRDDAAAQQKGLADLRIDDHVQIPLAVP
ncbi:hypothetical protein SDC9_187897 [bioreactor metagenome]|uniref:Uncharacterized protein n=1 Tax=bioreactor metagenome TaxID=1076179 RepID=A0A645HMS8_9ZZZZ